MDLNTSDGDKTRVGDIGRHQGFGKYEDNQIYMALYTIPHSLHINFCEH